VKCGVFSFWDSNQLGTDALLEFFFSLNLAPIFHCAMSVRKGVGGLEFVFRDQIKVMKESSNFRSNCGGNHHLC
jgi:hypothetical protein